MSLAQEGIAGEHLRSQACGRDTEQVRLARRRKLTWRWWGQHLLRHHVCANTAIQSVTHQPRDDTLRGYDASGDGYCALCLSW